MLQTEQNRLSVAKTFVAYLRELWNLIRWSQIDKHFISYEINLKVKGKTHSLSFPGYMRVPLPRVHLNSFYNLRVLFIWR